MSNNYLIPWEKCLEGVKSCVKHAENLIEYSQLLKNNDICSISIFLSIIASEEIAKGFILLKHFKEEKGITREDWKTITSGHENKLKEFNLHKWDESIINPEFKEKVEKHEFKELQNMKNDMLYVDWKRNSWQTDSDIFESDELIRKCEERLYEAQDFLLKLKEEIK